jgi:hypothetical protein
VFSLLKHLLSSTQQVKIRASILIILLSVLTLQLILGTPFDVKTTENKTETESSCCKSKCTPEPVEEDNECEKNKCNPLMSCPLGNFYVVSPSYVSITSIILPRQKMLLIDDNRLSAKANKCWRPPKLGC